MRHPAVVVPEDPHDLLRFFLELGVVDVAVGHVEETLRRELRHVPTPAVGFGRELRGGRASAEGVEHGELLRLLEGAAPDGHLGVLAPVVGVVVVLVRLRLELARQLARLGRLRNRLDLRLAGEEVLAADFAQRRNRVQDGVRERLADDESFVHPPALALEDEAAPDETVHQFVLVERLVELLRGRRSVDDQMRVPDRRGRGFPRAAARRDRLAAAGVDAVRGRERLEEDRVHRVEARLRSLEGVEEEGDLVRLEQHARRERESVLEALARGEGVAHVVAEAGLHRERHVHPARGVLAGARRRERQEVEVRAIVRGVAELAPREHREHRQGAGEGKGAVRVLGRAERVVLEVVYEARNVEEFLRQLAGVFGFPLGGFGGRVGRLHLLEDAREVHAGARVGGLAVSLREKVLRGRGRVAAVFEERVDRERRAVESRRERIGVGREHVEVDAVERRRESVAGFARALPRFVLALLPEIAPAVSFQQTAEGGRVPVVGVAGTLVERGRRCRRGMVIRLHRHGDFGEGPRGLQKHTALLRGDCRNRSERALHEMVAGAGRAQEEPAFAARFDERGSLPVPLASGELEVAFDGLLGAVHGVEAAAGRALDDQAAEQIGRHAILPRPEAFAAGVEVDALEIPRRRARHEAEGPVVVGEPRLDLLLRRQSLLVGAPAGERRALVRGDGRQHAESGSQIVSCELDGNPPRGVRRGLRHRDSRDWRWEGTGSRRWSGIVRRKRGGP